MASVLRVASLWHNAAELQIKIAAVATIREIACFILNTPFGFCVGPGAGTLLIDAILGSIVAEPHRNRQVLDGGYLIQVTPFLDQALVFRSAKSTKYNSLGQRPRCTARFELSAGGAEL